MGVLFDTNILIHLVRDNTSNQNQVRQIVNATNRIEYISVVNVGEVYSFAMQASWGQAKIVKMSNIISNMTVFGISDEEVLRKYAEIDAFSKKKHPTKTMNITARKMGKNDLWIAAVASILQIPLATTDKDFDHLDNVFLKVEYYNPKFF
jgi:tRNA(fMet)-specific endonuclease VapC